MAIKTYGSVNGQSKELKTIYGSVNGQSKKLVKLYGSVNGVSKLIYEETNDETQYGKVYYYSTFAIPSWSDAGSTNMQIQYIDITGLTNFVSQRNVMVDNGKIDMWYWSDGNNVSYQQEGGGWSQIDVNTLYTQYNIQAWRGPDYSSQGELLINYSAGSVDKTSTIVSADLLSSTEYTGLGNNTSDNPFNTCTVGGNTIPFAAIQKFVFGTDNTTTPSCFLRGSGAEEVDFRYASSLASIGAEFLESCSSLTAMSTLPSSLTTIGNLFLYGCSSFNQSLDLSHLTSIGANFLAYCASFNQPITLPNTITAVPGNFLGYCSSFNQTITIPSSVATIGGTFLSHCTAFNQPIVLPDSVNSINANFLAYCSSFNQDITVPSGVTYIGTYFMYNCKAMTSTLTVNCAATVATTGNETLATNSPSAACYVTGIKLSGTYKNEWHTRFPDRTSSPYRKTIVA